MLINFLQFVYHYEYPIYYQEKKTYAIVITVIICSMLVASVHASRTVLKNNSYCWLETVQDEKLVFILDAFFCCFIPFIVISILNTAIFIALFRARREASHLHESTTTVAPISRNQFSSTSKNRVRAQSHNLQITIMLITISISFFVLTLPNALYYLLILSRILIESWKAVICDENLYRNLDTYVQTSAVMYLISNITSDLMHVVNFFLYFISGERFRTEFRRFICYHFCHWCHKRRQTIFSKEIKVNEHLFLRKHGTTTVGTLKSIPGTMKQSYLSKNNSSTSDTNQHRILHLSSTEMNASDENSLTSSGKQSQRNQNIVPILEEDNRNENHVLIRQE